MPKTIAEYQLALCLAEKECPGCSGTGYTRGTDTHGHLKCSTCHGTGKRPLLEGVREECITGWTSIGHRPNCPTCNARGLVPSTDPFKYAEALKVRIKETNDTTWSGMILRAVAWEIYRGPLALFKALVEALGVKDA